MGWIVLGNGIPFRRGGGKQGQTYWNTLISATVENAAPTNVVLTFPTAKPSLGASDFTIAGFTISSASWTGAVLTLVLSAAVLPYNNLTITFVRTGQTHAVTNNVNSTQIGNIVTDDFARAALGANYEENTPSMTVALDGSKLTWTQVTALTWAEYVVWNQYVSLERWYAEMTFKPSQKNSGSHGMALRLESFDLVNNFNCMIQLNTSDNGTYGGLSYIGKNDDSGNLDYTDTKITITAGHSYKLWAKREKNTITYGAENLTDHSTNSGSYTYPETYPQADHAPNYGKIGFQAFGGNNTTNYQVTSFIINSEAFSNPKTALIGDSISQGTYVGADLTKRFFDVLFGTGNTKFNLMASGGDKIATLNTRVAEILLYEPYYALIMIGANDTGTNHATWQTSYETFLDTLIAAGITPIVCYPTPQTNNITWMNTIIDSICAARSVKVINTFTPLKAVADNKLHASYDAGDGLHPNSAGHALIASTILAAAPEII